jgi:pentatricopeptide repeat protein
MPKFNCLALALVFFQASVHHSFVPTAKPYAYVGKSEREATTRRSLSTVLAESDRDVINENSSSFDEYEYEYDHEYSMDEITRQILNGDEEDDSPYSDDEWATLTTQNILSMLNYHSKKKTVDGAETIDKLLDTLEGLSDTGENHYYKLHCGHYTIAVTAWSRSGHPESAERATLVVNRMKDRNIELNAVTYNTWMTAHAIQNNVSKVEEILRDMEEKIPNEIRAKDYNVLIFAYARQGRAKEAEQIVKSMVDRYSSGESLVLPDLVTYSMLLDAWSRSGEEGRGTRAETILDSIEERQITFDSMAYIHTDHTTSSAYVAVMRAIIHSGEKNIIERVENVYERALDQGIIPDGYVYATLLDAYATHPNACPLNTSERVAEIIAMAETNIRQERDKIVVYNTVLKLFKESREPNAINKAEELFKKMKSQGTFDQVTYSTMIALYTNNSKHNSSSAKRAEEVFDEMINEKGLEASAHHINSLMNSLVSVGNIHRASALLDKMEEEYRNGNESIKPNVVSYTTLMSGWMKSNSAQKSRQSTKVFDKMMAMFKSGNKDAEPNFVSYVTLVDSIAKSGEDGAAERVEKIVRDMYQSYKEGRSNFKPNAMLVSTAIDCWSKSGDRNAGERAEALLNWLLSIYKEDKDPQLLPEAHPFASCKSKCWQQSEFF